MNAPSAYWVHILAAAAVLHGCSDQRPRNVTDSAATDARLQPAAVASRTPPLRDGDGIWVDGEIDCISAVDVEHGALPLLARLESLPAGANGTCRGGDDLNACSFTFSDGLEYTLYDSTVFRKVARASSASRLPLGLSPGAIRTRVDEDFVRRRLAFQRFESARALEIPLCSMAASLRTEFDTDDRLSSVVWVADFDLRCAPSEPLQFGPVSFTNAVTALPAGAVSEPDCDLAEECSFVAQGVSYDIFQNAIAKARLEVTSFRGALPLGLQPTYDRARTAAVLTDRGLPWELSEGDLVVAGCGGGDPWQMITFGFDRSGRLSSIELFHHVV